LICWIQHLLEKQETNTIYIEKSAWIRAMSASLRSKDHGTFKKGTVLGYDYRPFGKFERKIKAPNDGYIINANLSPIVYQGDAALLYLKL
jgi:hypothetical protein